MEEDSRDESQVLRQTFEKLISKVHQDGFREGVEEGKARSFQRGFDQGYVQGFAAGFTQASFNGALRTLNAVSVPAPEVSKLTAPHTAKLEELTASHTAKLEELTAPHRAMCQLCLTSRSPDSLSEAKACQAFVLSNSELQSRYRRLNQWINHEVIRVDDQPVPSE